MGRRGRESTKVHEVRAQEIGSWPADKEEPWELVCVLNHTSQLVPSWPTRPSISLALHGWVMYLPPAWVFVVLVGKGTCEHRATSGQGEVGLFGSQDV